MTRRILAALLLLAGLAGLVVCIVWLTREGLDRAEKWVSIAGVTLSVLIGVAGVVLGWLTWRQTAATPPVNASGPGSVGIGGDSGGEVSTEVSGTPAAPGPTGASGVNASGPGSVAIGGNSTAPIRTKVTGK